MKQRLLYILIIAAVFFAPVEPLNIANLRPVQVIAFYGDGENLVIETDTRDRGVGTTPQQALQNLKDTAKGVLYLDTAEYILMEDTAQSAVEALRWAFRKSAKICRIQGQIALEDAADFLASHGKLPKIKEWKAGADLPVLEIVEEHEKN